MASEKDLTSVPYVPAASREGLRPIPDTVWGIMVRAVIQIARRPVMWVAMFLLPLFMFLFFGTMLDAGLPTRIPAGMVDRDGTKLSREITQTLSGMQMVDIKQTPNSYTEARRAVQSGEIYGFFLIPENFQADLLAGRKPVITFYTNMTYYVPGSLLYKTFKATAIYTKAGIAMQVVNSVGVDAENYASLLQPVNIATRGIGNPQLNYGIYLANSFLPAVLQLMIMLCTVFSLGQEIKYKTSPRLMRMAHGSIVKALFGKFFPQTVCWWIMAFFLTAWLYRFNHYPMYGSWWVMALNEFMFVLAAQSFAVAAFGLLPNLRLALSICALTGILTFSIAAYSFPEQSMYPGMAIFSYLMPARYNFLIYANTALNGLPIRYSIQWFGAYLLYGALAGLLMMRIKRAFINPVYAP